MYAYICTYVHIFPVEIFGLLDRFLYLLFCRDVVSLSEEVLQEKIFLHTRYALRNFVFPNRMRETAFMNVENIEDSVTKPSQDIGSVSLFHMVCIALFFVCHLYHLCIEVYILIDPYISCNYYVIRCNFLLLVVLEGK